MAQSKATVLATDEQNVGKALQGYIKQKYPNAPAYSPDDSTLAEMIRTEGPDAALKNYEQWADQNSGNLYAVSSRSHGTADEYMYGKSMYGTPENLAAAQAGHPFYGPDGGLYSSGTPGYQAALSSTTKAGATKAAYTPDLSTAWTAPGTAPAAAPAAPKPAPAPGTTSPTPPPAGAAPTTPGVVNATSGFGGGFQTQAPSATPASTTTPTVSPSDAFELPDAAKSGTAAGASGSPSPSIAPPVSTGNSGGPASQVTTDPSQATSSMSGSTGGSSSASGANPTTTGSASSAPSATSTAAAQTQQTTPQAPATMTSVPLNMAQNANSPTTSSAATATPAAPVTPTATAAPPAPGGWGGSASGGVGNQGQFATDYTGDAQQAKNSPVNQGAYGVIGQAASQAKDATSPPMDAYGNIIPGAAGSI